LQLETQVGFHRRTGFQTLICGVNIVQIKGAGIKILEVSQKRLAVFRK
jgi:hypothetical protein